MTHVHMIEDERGDLVDIAYACSPFCASAMNFPEPSAWPGGMETDYDVHCDHCGDLMWKGLQSDGD